MDVISLYEPHSYYDPQAIIFAKLDGSYDNAHSFSLPID